MTFDAIVLTGGRGSRLGGTNKSALRIADTDLLGRALAATAGARRVVVVGGPPHRALPDGVRLTREDPPLSGPAAAIAAGFEALGNNAADLVLLLACDMPEAAAAAPTLVEAARTALHAGADGALAIDDNGHAQPLLSCIGAASLRAAIAVAGPLAGVPVRRLTHGLDLRSVPVPGGATRDIDTPEDARRWGIEIPDQVHISDPKEHIMTDEAAAVSIEEWAAELCAGLGLPESSAAHVQEILDVTRDAAHALYRPAAPVAAFLVGLAAGRAGGSPEDVADACRIASGLARAHERDS